MNPLRQHPIIAWFVSNPVVANILMVCILAAGIRTALTIQKEGFPAFDAESVAIEVPILGGTPQDVERGVAMKIEEALLDVDGIDHVRSTSTESKATITVEAKEDYNLTKLLNDVKTQVDAISSFPEQAEKPIVSDNQRQRDVLWVEVYGDVSEALRKETARNLRDELLRQPAISKVEMFGSRDYEISIEPSEEKLRFYDLTFDELANAVSQNSFDLGSGVVRSPRGDIALRAREQAYLARDFEEIPVRTNPDGTRVFIRDVAEVRDAFVDQKAYNRFRGEPTTSLQITTEGQDDIVDAVEQAKAVVAKFNAIPEGLSVTQWLDGSTNISDRLSLLTTNGLIGVCLVLGILMLFLNLRLAFWVALGIPISLAGAISLFPLPGIEMTLNSISAFGFLVVLGIIVDDAIVIGEAVYAEKEKQDPDADNDHQTQLRSTVKGVSRVVTPATFGVITTLAAFLPLTQVSGRMGNVLGQIASAVLLCLVFSLIESKLILPAHLAHINVHRKPGNPISRAWVRFQSFFSIGLALFVRKIYLPTLKALMAWRYAVLAGFIAVFIITFALFPAGQLRFVFFPNIYRDNASVTLEMEQGLSVDYLHDNVQGIADIATELGEEYQEKFDHNPFKEIQISASSNTNAAVSSELTRSTERPFLSSSDIVQDWRKRVGKIAGARSVNFRVRAGPPGGDISINLESENLNALQAAAEETKKALSSYAGVYEVTDSFDSGQPEIRYRITPAGQAADFTKRDLAQNVRDAFFGREAQRIQRGREEVKVMVRYPLEKRGSLETLRDMRIRTTDGSAVPFDVIAETDYSSSLASIQRYDYKRVVSVEASVDKTSTSSQEILARMQEDFFPDLLVNHPEIALSQSGEAEQRKKSMTSLINGFYLSIALIYILIAIPLRSYFQPIIIMVVIPFGIIGALLGHWLMEIPISILSIYGILALSGVVVNDSLVLVCALKDLKDDEKKLTLKERIQRAGATRFRPILLTSLTTFFGLVPLLLEDDVQAQFLKPMAASLAFGILFATLITLILLPLLYLIADDLRKALRWIYRK